MKLLELKAAGFGPLRRLERGFDAASCVIWGPNEAGKTSFIDALSSSLFGLPRRSTNEGKEFEIRYDLESCQSESVWLRADGDRLTSSAEKPRGKELLSPAVFKSLLLIRGGRCPMNKEDEDFIPAFLNLVMGSGAVDLKQASASLAKITSGQPNRLWDKIVSPLHKDVARLKESLQTADSQAGADQRVLNIRARIEQLGSDQKALLDELASLDAAKATREASTLRDLQSRINQGAQRLEHRDGLNDAAHAKLLDLEARLKDAQAARQISRARAEALEIESQNSRETLEKNKHALEGLPAAGLRAGLKSALDDLSRAQSAAVGGLPRPWRAAVAGALAVAAGALAWHLWGLPAAAAAVIAAAACGWLALGAWAKAPAGGLETARLKCELALQALGPDWQALALDEARRRLEEFDKKADQTAWEKISAAQRLEQKAAQLARMREECQACGKRIEELQKTFQEELRTWGCETSAMAGKKLSDLEVDRRQLKTLLADLSKTLGRAITDPREADVAIRKILSRDEAGPAAALSSEISRDEQESRLASCKRNLEQTRAQINASQKELEQAIAQASRLEGRLAGTPAQLNARLKRRELHLEDLELWREAARVAEDAIQGLCADTARSLQGCVRDAAPLFEQMTQGRYTGVALAGEKPFESQALQVTHPALGARPAEWLSQGTQDLLWLALRMAWAKKAFPRAGFLILDEPCVNLDSKRAAAAVQALFRSPVLAGWQIILLTKDDRIAAACAEAGAMRAELS